MSQVPNHERDEFFRRHFAVTGNRPIRERKGAALVEVSLNGRPVRSKEYRAALLALPPGPKRRTPAEIAAWIDELEAGATS